MVFLPRPWRSHPAKITFFFRGVAWSVGESVVSLPAGPRAEVARELLPEELRRRGATVDVVSVYRTVKAQLGSIREILESETVDCIVFTSPSAIPDDLAPLPANIAVAVIGPVTREAAQILGFGPAIVPVQSTIPALVEAIRKHLMAG